MNAHEHLLKVLITDFHWEILRNIIKKQTKTEKNTFLSRNPKRGSVSKRGFPEYQITSDLAYDTMLE